MLGDINKLTMAEKAPLAKLQLQLQLKLKLLGSRRSWSKNKNREMFGPYIFYPQKINLCFGHFPLLLPREYYTLSSILCFQSFEWTHLDYEKKNDPMLPRDKGGIGQQPVASMGNLWIG